jgi:hypothetical protein
MSIARLGNALWNPPQASAIIGLRYLRSAIAKSSVGLGYLPIVCAAYIMVLLKFALARCIELQFVDGPPRLTGLAVLRPFCTKTQSAAPGWVWPMCCSMENWSPERGGTGTEPLNRQGDCLPLIDLSPWR